jgi:2-succinyl-6-hydroxy-2,4-cyclohexadiene-1-carboxylate synthase
MIALMETYFSSLFCIHGFLGQAEDWKKVLPAHISTTHFDLFSSEVEKRPSLDFKSLSHWINSAARLQQGTKVLMGYSLGGRIALSALLEQPGLWSAAVIIAAHPGLQVELDRKKRVELDEKWAMRFEEQEWISLLSDWNSQPVLKESSVLFRKEECYSRKALAESLRGCSLGVQADFRQQIQDLRIPILWVVGENDLKFLAVAKEVAFLNPQITLLVIPNAAHRAPWDQPEFFKSHLLEFLARIHFV